jgi:hypothetical protein
MRPQKNPVRWEMMVLCAVATCLPLIAGLIRDELMISVYGSLAGYLLSLSVNSATLKKRIGVVLFTYLMLVAGFCIGYNFHQSHAFYLVLFTATVYWLGILAGHGDDLERTVLFTTISIIAGNGTPKLPMQVFPAIVLYTLTGLVVILAGVIIIYLTTEHQPRIVNDLKTSLKRSFIFRKRNRSHAASYAIAALLSIFIAQLLKMERANWVTITVLLVMKPDQNAALYRSAQRFAGTILAVIFMDVLVQVYNDRNIMLVLIVACALFTPWAAQKNYWIVSFLSTIMAVFMLELTSANGLSIHTPFVRLAATILGCALAVLGIAISRTTDKYIRVI